MLKAHRQSAVEHVSRPPGGAADPLSSPPQADASNSTLFDHVTSRLRKSSPASLFLSGTSTRQRMRLAVSRSQQVTNLAAWSPQVPAAQRQSAARDLPGGCRGSLGRPARFRTAGHANGCHARPCGNRPTSDRSLQAKVAKRYEANVCDVAGGVGGNLWNFVQQFKCGFRTRLWTCRAIHGP
jgi:hypothetical protein